MFRWGVDAGGTSTTVLTSDGHRWTCGSVNPGSVGADTAGDRLRGLFRELARRAAGRDAVGWLATAAYEPSGGARVAEQVARLAGDAGLPGRLAVSNDTVPWLLAPPLHGRGVVAVCGTGSGFLARAEHGGPVRVGGCEYLGSDEGSAFDLGLAGLRAAVRAADGRAGPTALTGLLAGRFGMPAPEAARSLAGRAFPKAAVAALAPLVCRAWRDGDATAGALVRAALDELLLGVRTARDRAGLDGGWSMAAGGGVLRNCPGLFREFAGRVRTGLGAREVVLVDDPARTVLAGLTALGPPGPPGGRPRPPEWQHSGETRLIELPPPPRARPAARPGLETGPGPGPEPEPPGPEPGPGPEVEAVPGPVPRLGVCLGPGAGPGPERALGRALAGARRLGVRTVDLPTDSTAGLVDLARWAGDRDHRAALRALVRGSGLEVGCVSNSHDALLLLGPHGPHTDPVCPGTGRQKRAHALRAALDTVRLAADLGTGQVRLMLGVPDFGRWMSWWGSGVSWADNVAAWAEAARPVLAEAARHRITLLLEPHPKQVAYDRPSTEAVLAAAAGAGGAPVRLCLDPANFAAVGHDPVEAVRGWGTAPAAVHAKDVQRWPGPGAPDGPGWTRYGPGPPFRFRAAGSGELPWRAILAALAEERFTGVLYVEHQDALLPAGRGMAAALRTLRALLPPPPPSQSGDGDRSRC
ncbi:TIM barrel protein [Streptomyces aidingensis]|uniref:BadF-type ATPase n=1 Tax=Streptomyces aidingensis TaxID=910347 RepID=A0A1I1SLQ3_9ACTN|nr:TIM barrel protein [Streptomyces aidingensis]SFD47415.1 BadF-type ATPase [Streptomyces aidingensis]